MPKNNLPDFREATTKVLREAIFEDRMIDAPDYRRSFLEVEKEAVDQIVALKDKAVAEALEKLVNERVPLPTEQELEDASKNGYNYVGSNETPAHDYLNDFFDSVRRDDHEGACWDLVRAFIVLADYHANKRILALSEAKEGKGD